MTVRRRLILSLMAGLLTPFLPRPEVEFPIPVAVIAGLVIAGGYHDAVLYGLLAVVWLIGSGIIFSLWTVWSKLRMKR